jgi:hypothetical protein
MHNFISHENRHKLTFESGENEMTRYVLSRNVSARKNYLSKRL